jgi:parallel beta-helix repeat protein
VLRAAFPLRTVTAAYRPRPGATPVYASGVPRRTAPPSESLPPFALRDFPPAASDGPEIAVDPASFGRLSAVIADAPEGATISVPAGVYTECLTIDKSLNFVAAGRVSLRGGAAAEALLINAPVVTFEGFSIKQKINPSRAAVAVLGGAVSFTNCSLRSPMVAALLLKEDAQVRLTACAVKAGACPAVNLTGRAQVAAAGCVFSHSRMIAVTVKQQSAGRFTECVFRENQKGGASASENSALFVDSCQFDDCSVDIASDGQTVVTGCRIERRTGGGAALGTGIVATKRSRAFIYDTTITRACVDARDNARITLHRNTFSGSTLIVCGESEVDSLGDAFGGEAAAAVFVSDHGRLDLVDATIAGVTQNGIVATDGTTVTIKGIKIEGAGKTGIMASDGVYLTVTEAEIRRAADYGIQSTNAATVKLTQIEVEAAGKSGIEVNGASTVLELSRLRLSGNGYCGAVVARATGTIETAEFDGNRFSGLHLQGADVRLTDGIFAANEKGGFFLSGNSSFTVAGGQLRNNRWAGAVVESGSKLTAARLTVENNETGLAIGGVAEIDGATFTANDSAGLLVGGGNATVKNGRFAHENQGAITASKGVLRLVACQFEDNILHAGATEGAEVIAVEESSFVSAKGEYAIRVVDARATFTNCAFRENSTAAIFSEGEVNIEASEVSDSGAYGAVFQKGASGVIRDTKFENNGLVAFQVLQGAPTISGNTIVGHSQFGIFVCADANPVIEGNIFEGKNGDANVWRE